MRSVYVQIVRNANKLAHLVYMLSSTVRSPASFGRVLTAASYAEVSLAWCAFDLYTIERMLRTCSSVGASLRTWSHTWQASKCRIKHQ